jgi:hypothetical protein
MLKEKKEFTAICQVHDILTKGLDETLSFAIPNNAKSEDTAYLHNSISAQSGQSVSQQNISKNNKTNLEKIWHIIVVKETNRTSRFIIINKNYPDAIEVKGRNFSKCVIALSEAILNKTKILEIDDILQCKDFLNKNFRCRIYKSHDGKKQKYNITDIVVTEKTFHEDEQLKITNAMKSEVITYADYQKRLNNYYASRQT